MYNFAIPMAIALALATASCASNGPATKSTAASQPGASNSNAAQNAAPKPFKPPPGFRARTVDGKTVYCKKTVVLGSRLPTNVCMDEEQLKQYEANNEAMRIDKERASSLCPQTNVCGGN